MPHPELEKYISTSRQNKISEQYIRDRLTKSGWSDKQINEGLFPSSVTNNTGEEYLSSGYSKLQLVLIFTAFCFISFCTVGLLISVWFGGLLARTNQTLFSVISVSIPVVVAIFAFNFFLKKERLKNQSNLSSSVERSTTPQISSRKRLPTFLIGVLGAGFGLVVGFTFIFISIAICSSSKNCPPGEDGWPTFVIGGIYIPVIFGVVSVFTVKIFRWWEYRKVDSRK